MKNLSFCYKSKVTFSDTDAAGVAHFTSIQKYIENAEHTFFESRGVFSLDRGYSWPRVSVEIRYLAPLRFREEFEINLFDFQKEKYLLCYSFKVFSQKEEKKREIAFGKKKIACLYNGKKEEKFTI